MLKYFDQFFCNKLFNLQLFRNSGTCCGNAEGLNQQRKTVTKTQKTNCL